MTHDVVTALDVDGDRVRGVVLRAGGRVAAATVVLAAGVWSGGLAGLPPDLVPVRPVKGQLLRLHVPVPFRPLLRHTVRGLVRGSSVYLVPRVEGELVVGATMEEQGFDVTVTAGAVYELLRDARELLPAITELPLVETSAGLRPGTADNAPLLGRCALPGLVLATGHHRNGVLLAPGTAEAIAEVLAGGDLPSVAAPFSPDRFTPTPSEGRR